MAARSDSVDPVNPIYKVLQQGVEDDASPLSWLKGTPHIVQKIWHYIADYWKSLIEAGSDGDKPEGVNLDNEVFIKGPYVLPCYYSSFPDPKDIYVNMMPFIMAREFEETKLPDYLEDYFWLFVLNCDSCVSEDYGKVCYISVHEGMVTQGTSQRRPGVHTDNPGKVVISSDVDEGKGTSNIRWYEHGWGNGWIIDDRRKTGGIYMCSSLKNTCKAWNCKILRDTSTGDEIIGKLGDCEHLKEFLPEHVLMENNQMYWITDRTPHESLPLHTDAYRQWFRLVTSEVSLWYEDHSTSNPNGVLPDPKITKIVKGSKFDEHSLTIVPYEESCSSNESFSSQD